LDQCPVAWTIPTDTAFEAAEHFFLSGEKRPINQLARRLCTRAFDGSRFASAERGYRGQDFGRMGFVLKETSQIT